MAKEKVPAFQFYPKDFLTDEKVVLMSNTEVGIYVRLLCFCWLEGTLPLETECLARMARLPLKQFTKLWEQSVLRQCFQVGEDGRLHHKRLDLEREKQENYRRRQVDAAASRWHMPKVSQPDAAVAMPPECSPISDLQSPISDLQIASSSPPPRPRGMGQPPHLVLKRIKVWRWQIEEIIRVLGDQAETFGALDEWFHELDGRDGGVITDNWGYIWAQTLHEAVRRGCVIADTSVPVVQHHKRNVAAVAGGQAFLRRQHG